MIVCDICFCFCVVKARQANWLFPQASSDNRWYDMWMPFLSDMETTDEETGNQYNGHRDRRES